MKQNTEQTNRFRTASRRLHYYALSIYTKVDDLVTLNVTFFQKFASSDYVVARGISVSQTFCSVCHCLPGTFGIWCFNIILLERHARNIICLSMLTFTDLSPSQCSAVTSIQVKHSLEYVTADLHVGKSVKVTNTSNRFNYSGQGQTQVTDSVIPGQAHKHKLQIQ